MNNIDVSIIVVNYNTINYTQQCIDSIFEQTKDVNFEVILVDNDSKDGSAEHFCNDNRIKFIQSGANLGFGKANNLGYEHASPNSKYIFLLNSDTKLLNNAVKIFYDYMESAEDNISCIGTKLLNAQGLRPNNELHRGIGGYQISVFESIIAPFKKLISSNNKIVGQQNKPIFQVGYILGADMFIRREVVKQIGLFDPDFFMYYEEMELQYRYNKAGFRQMIISGPQIIHYAKVSSGKGISAKLRTMMFHGKCLYFKKTNNILAYSLFRIVEVLRIPLVIKMKYSAKDNLNLVKIFFTKAENIM